VILISPNRLSISARRDSPSLVLSRSRYAVLAWSRFPWESSWRALSSEAGWTAGLATGGLAGVGLVADVLLCGLVDAGLAGTGALGGNTLSTGETGSAGSGAGRFDLFRTMSTTTMINRMTTATSHGRLLG